MTEKHKKENLKIKFLKTHMKNQQNMPKRIDQNKKSIHYQTKREEK